MAQLLLSYSPDVEARDSMGWTPLMIACELSHTRDSYNKLMIAAAGHYDVVNELVHAGAKVDATNEKGQTPLHYAASKGYVQVSFVPLIPGSSADGRLVDCSSTAEQM
jgi:26S proteasome non-ATPase regulatory subunit 10